MSRSVVLGIVLLLIGAGLWTLNRKKIITNDTLDIVEKIGSIIAVIAAIILFISPSLGAATQSSSSDEDYYYEDFSKDTGSWPTGNEEHDWGVVESYIQEGKFYWEATAYTDQLYHLPLPSSLPNVSNFQLEVDFSLVDGVQNYGLTFRRQDNSFYYFPVDENGHYQLALFDQETQEWKQIIDWDSYPEVEDTVPSRLRVIAEGSNYKLYINDDLVAESNDATLLGGDIGIGISVAAGENAAIEVDSFRLSPIKTD